MARHSVGDGGAGFDGLPSAPLPGGGGVACVVCVCLCGGVRFGALCTIVSSSSYIIYERVVLLLSFKKITEV